MVMLFISVITMTDLKGYRLPKFLFLTWKMVTVIACTSVER